MRYHVVRPGEHLRGIAHARGVDPSAVWESDDNAALRAARGDGSCLLPGDVLRLPDGEEAPSADLSAGASNRFRATVPRVTVRVRLMDRGEPISDEAWEADEGGRVRSGMTDSDGWAELDVRVTTRRLRLEVPACGHVLHLEVGGLDPADQPSGVDQRLRRLGYLRGASGGSMGPRVREALARFQRASGLAPTGTLDPETTAALARAASGGSR